MRLIPGGMLSRSVSMGMCQGFPCSRSARACNPRKEETSRDGREPIPGPRVQTRSQQAAQADRETIAQNPRARAKFLDIPSHECPLAAPALYRINPDHLDCRPIWGEEFPGSGDRPVGGFFLLRPDLCSHPKEVLAGLRGDS